ncbi:helix-turn-helix transcriptional regulator [Paenibacillus tarimensis]|uniref:helix-turn-helix transcriptional regulator n=1 Tax=Paenibacillus tarimensis TaxID=416012 RepID=UPI001F399E26|nr:LuxR C-terminal-related transcriptional regulator [Paenibacillus tarimensis]MCF2944067.1 LuxR C-terminal-related transcriptional regulator [Paenibacillus tarimensis]
MEDWQKNGSPPTIGRQMQEWMESDFVGRAFELHLIEEYIARLELRDERIINIHGTGGIGKTSLLGRCRTLARKHGARYAELNMKDMVPNPGQVYLRLLTQLGLPAPHTDKQGEDVWANWDIVNELAERHRIVLAIDHYEAAGLVDQWLREQALPKLHTNILIIVAGRYPLAGRWRLSSAWQRLIVPLPLKELSYEETCAYLQRSGIQQEQAMDAIWLRTFGHPLVLSLAVPLARHNRIFDPSRTLLPLDDIMDLWLQEITDTELRQLVMAASIPRTFNLETLSLLLENELPVTRFEELIRLSFVSQSSRGWNIHELVRETLQHSFRRRMPDTYDKLNAKALQIFSARIRNRIANKQDITQEVAEVVTFSDNPVLRAHFRHTSWSQNVIERFRPDNMPELLSYLERRMYSGKGYKIVCSDPDSATDFSYTFTAEQGLLRLKAFDIPGMHRHGAELKILRNPEGRMIGLLAEIPIHSRSLKHLTRAPVTSAYFKQLPPAILQSMRTSEEDSIATYMLTVDVEDPEDQELRSDMIRMQFGCMLSGRIVVTSPPPLDYYRMACISLGFREVPGAVHYDYDGVTPASTYMLDTRTDKIPELLAFLAGPQDIDKHVHVVKNNLPLLSFTQREQEVAERLIKGETNRQIAGALYISEAAVKKHVQSMLQKTGLRNRTQLAKTILEHN